MILVNSNVKTQKAQDLIRNIMSSESFLSTKEAHSEVLVYEFLNNEVAGKLELKANKKYIIFYHSASSLQNFSALNSLENILGFVDLGLADDICLKQIEKIVTTNSSDELVKLGETLNDLIRNSVTELQRVRKIHEKLVPLRESDLKGVRLTAKFAAGEAPGGEFFDYVKIGQELVFVASSTNSYIITSLVLNNFEKLKAKKELSLDSFIIALHQDLKGSGFNIGAGSRDKFELLLFRLDLKKLTMSGHIFGGFRLYKNSRVVSLGKDIPFDRSFIEKSSFDMDLDRQDKLIVLTPGVQLNSRDYLGEMPLNDFIVDNFNKGPRNFLSEVFYQLKKDRESDFLAYDSAAVVLEVDTHVMYET